MRGSRGRVLWALRRRKMGFPLVFLSCSLFFLAGFFGSVLFSQDPSAEAVPRVRYTEAAVGEGVELFAMPHGESGETHPSPIPYQVLSWKPRALYFPKFASAEQCQTIVQKAKSRLKPSSLALRKGENEENTKGVRTRMGWRPGIGHTTYSLVNSEVLYKLTSCSSLSLFGCLIALIFVGWTKFKRKMMRTWHRRFRGRGTVMYIGTGGVRLLLCVGRQLGADLQSSGFSWNLYLIFLLSREYFIMYSLLSFILFSLISAVIENCRFIWPIYLALHGIKGDRL